MTRNSKKPDRRQSKSDEITYKFVKGRGWVAGYWKEPNTFAWKINYAELEQDILQRMQELYNQDLWEREANEWLMRTPVRETPRQYPRELMQREIAERDAGYIRHGVVTPNEVRTVRFPQDRIDALARAARNFRVVAQVHDELIVDEPVQWLGGDYIEDEALRGLAEYGIVVDDPDADR